ncbi:MAG: 50S ribosomal protein L25/general stress protein Ctc [Alphaproteobacteria bacterium]
MAEMSTLAVEPREGRGKGGARAVRREGLVPGIVYGAGSEPTLVAMEGRALMRELRKPGFFAQLYQLKVGDAEERVLPRAVQFDPVSDAPIHFDLMRVSSDMTIVVAIPVRFLQEGASPGLKAGGVLNVVRHEVELHCPVDAIPDHIEIDLTDTQIGESIHFSRVTGAADMKPVITDRDFTIATIAPPTVATAAAAGEGEEEEGEED